MDYTRIAVPDLFVRIAEALGKNTSGLSDEDASKLAVEGVRELMADIHIPKGLKDVGVSHDAFATMAKDAVESGIHLTTPRKVSYEDMVALYEAAY
jgi:alcohol dehydrogenase class IV